MKRRSSLVAGVAVVAGAAGLGAALWRARHPPAPPVPSLWDLSFDKPAGGQLTLASLRGHPLLLNFWATWCPPCVSEMPLLDRFHRDHAQGGFQVAGLAVDQLQPVNDFLAKHPVAYPIGLAGAEGIGLARQLGNSGGALPFSVLFDAGGHAVQRRLGVLGESDLRSWWHDVG